MDINSLVERAKRQLNAGEPEPRNWPSSEIDIAACVMQALSKLSGEVMADPARRSLLQQTYSVTLDSSGVGDPLAATGSITSNTGEILMAGIWLGAVIDADNNPLKPLVQYASFISPQQLVYGYYCLKDRKILTRALGVAVNSPADIVSVNGPLTIVASFEPSEVDDVPSELEPDLVNALCAVVTLKVPASANA